MAHLLYRIGKYAYLHRLRFIGAWILALVIFGAAAGALSKPFLDNFNLPGIPSAKATNLINSKFGDAVPDPFKSSSADIVFASKDGSPLDSSKNMKAINDVIANILKLPDVKNPSTVVNPLLPPKAPTGPLTAQQQAAVATQKAIAGTKTPAQAAADAVAVSPVNPDKTVAKMTVNFTPDVTDLPKNFADKLTATGDVGTKQGIDVEMSGTAATSNSAGGGSSEIIGLAVAAVVLVITFGSMVAWGLPLISAIIGLGIAVSGVLAATHFTTLGSTTPVLASMIGIAVAVDYSLFIVSRYRHELTKVFGTGKEARAEAIGRAVGTAGSAVIFAGLTVIIALVALSVVGIPFLAQMGLAAAFSVLIAVLVAITFLPAVLGVFGTKVFAGRVPGLRPPDTADRGEDDESAVGHRLASTIKRFPLVIFLCGVVLLGVIATPIVDLKLALPSAGTADPSTAERKAYDITTRGFGAGANGLLVMALDGSKIPQDQRLSSYAKIVSNISDLTSYVQNAQITGLNAGRDAAIVTVTPKTGPTADATSTLVKKLRSNDGVTKGFDVNFGVTGETAIELDVSQKLGDALIPYLIVVVGLAFILLLIAFRSLLVPLTAALGFALSVGATFGATVAVFQKGIFGIVNNPQPLVSFLPLFLVGIVFGLAMDYQVFLVSRMREEFVHSKDSKQAVVKGLQHGARVVTAAAIIMMSVFAAFMLQGQIFVKLIGFALSSAVLFDAFIVRMILIPSVMTLLGDRAWYLPKWLDKIIPNVDIEGEKLFKILDERDAGGEGKREPANV